MKIKKAKKLMIIFFIAVFSCNNFVSLAVEKKKSVKVRLVSSKNANYFLLLGYLYIEKANSANNPVIKKKYINESFKNFNEVLNYNPKSSEAHIGLAKAYLADGKEGKANDELLTAQEMDISNPETSYEIGEFCYNMEEYERALKFLTKAISNKSVRSYKAHFLLGNMYERLAEIDKAKTEYQEALRLNPAFTDAQNSLNSVNSEIPTSAEETPTLISTTNQEPYENGESFLINNKPSEAREIYRKILQSNPDNKQALAGIAEAYDILNIQGYFEGEDYFNDSQILDDNPTFAKMIIERIKFTMVNGQGITDSDKEELQKLSKQESDDFYDQINSLRADFILENFQQASEKLKNLLNQEISDKQKLEIAKYLYFDHNLAEAQNILESPNNNFSKPEKDLLLKGIKNNLNNSDNLLALGQNYYKANNYSEALSRLEQSLKYFPANKLAHLYYAYTLYKVGYLDKALAELDIYSTLEQMYPSLKPELDKKGMAKLIKQWKKNSNPH